MRIVVTAKSFYGIDLEGEPGPASTSEVLEVFELLRPRPSATPLVRVGGDRDGAYLVPDDLDGIAACFSPGVNRIKYFEDVLTDDYGIDAHMCDFTCDVEEFTTPLREGRQTFAKKWLDVQADADSITLEDWVAEHAPTGDLLLQMDIEGAEYRNVLATSRETMARFRIIVLEVHGLGMLLDGPELRSVLAPFFSKLAEDFTVVHAHPNNCCGDVEVPGADVRIPRVLELTLVRNDRFTAAVGPVLLPHPLDVGRNIPAKPPIFLSEAWCGAPRPLESRVKMLEDVVSYRDVTRSLFAEAAVAEPLPLMMQSLRTLRGYLPQGPPGELVEVARGRPFELSSAHGDKPQRGTVRASPNYFFHTDVEKAPWIRIDLGSSRRVRRIEVDNRGSKFAERARHVFVSLTEQSVGSPDAAVFPVGQDGPVGDGIWQRAALDLPDVMARYITFTAPVTTALHFSDLRVYVAEVPTPTPDPAPAPPVAPTALRSAYGQVARRLPPPVKEVLRPAVPTVKRVVRRLRELRASS